MSEGKIKELIKHYEWHKKQCEHNTGTAQKLDFQSEVLLQRTKREIYEDVIFKLENLIDNK